MTGDKNDVTASRKAAWKDRPFKNSIAATPGKLLDDSARTVAALKDRKWFVHSFDPYLGLEICEKVAAGRTLEEVCKGKNQPSVSVFLAWCTRVPELGEMFRLAREISAYVMEDEGLDMARKLRHKEAPTSPEVRAWDVALGQLRWTAGKRHPREFGDKAQTTFTVPIQINTSLPLERSAAGDNAPSSPDAVFHIEAKVEAPADSENGGSNVGAPAHPFQRVVSEWEAAVRKAPASEQMSLLRPADDWQGRRAKHAELAMRRGKDGGASARKRRVELLKQGALDDKARIRAKRIRNNISRCAKRLAAKEARAQAQDSGNGDGETGPGGPVRPRGLAGRGERERVDQPGGPETVPGPVREPGVGSEGGE